MKFSCQLIALAFFFFLNIFSTQLYAQAVVMVGREPLAGKSDYWFVYAIPKEEAIRIATDRLIEKGYLATQLEIVATTDQKGYGMIVKGEIEQENGQFTIVFGAAVGCKSYSEAEKLAIQNLKKNSTQSKSKKWVIIEKWFDI